MKAQLEIVTRRTGRFVKVQDVLSNGTQVATLHRENKQWVLTYTGELSYVRPIRFNSRDAACDYLFDKYTSEPINGPCSLLAWERAFSAYDRYIDEQYMSTDDYLLRQDAPAYESWLDHVQEVA